MRAYHRSNTQYASSTAYWRDGGSKQVVSARKKNVRVLEGLENWCGSPDSGKLEVM